MEIFRVVGRVLYEGADAVDRGLDKTRGKVDQLSDRFEAAGERISATGARMSQNITLPLVALGAGIIKIGSDFESAFAGVRKTVDATEAQFARLEDGIRNMSKELPASASSIADVAASAGQLGIETDNILEFTKVMIDLGEATNLTADQAATSLARLANITQLPQDQFDELGSTIVALGNNFATTEAEIVEMGLRIAGAGAQIGLTEAQILGIATSLSSVGIEAQAGGTAISKVMIDIANEVATGGDKLAQFADIAGVSVDEFTALFQEDAANAVITFIEGLDGASKAGENVFAILEELGFTEVRVRDALLRSAGAGDVLRDSVELGTEAWEENTALVKEAEQRYQTFSSQLAILRNRVSDVAIELFQRFRPAIVGAFGIIGTAIEGIASIVTGANDGVLSFVGTFLSIVAAAGPVLFVFGKLLVIVGALLNPFTLIAAAIAGLVALLQSNFLGVLDRARDMLTSFRQAFAGEWVDDENIRVLDRLAGLVGNVARAIVSHLAPIKQAFTTAFSFLAFVFDTRGLDGLIERIPFALDLIRDELVKFGGAVADAFLSVNWAEIGEDIYDELSGTAEIIASRIGDIDWAGLGQGLLDGLTGTAQFLAEQVRSIDWGDIASSIWSGIGEGLSTVGDLAGKAGNVGANILAFVAEQVTAVDWTEVSHTVINGIGDGLSTAATSATDLGTKLVSAVRTSAETTDWSSVGATIQEKIGTAFSGLSGFATSFEPIQQLVTWIQTNVLPVLSTVAEFILSRLTPTFDTWKASIQEIVATIQVQAGPLFQQLRETLVSIAPIAAVLGAALGVLAAILVGALLVALNTLANIIGAVLPTVFKILINTIQTWLAIIELVADVVVNMVKLVNALLKGDFAGAWKAAKTLVTETVDNIIAVIKGLLTQPVLFIQLMVDAIIALFTGLWHSLVGGSIVPDMVNGIIDWFAQLPSRAAEFIADMVARVLGYMAQFALDMLTKGGEAIQGVADGMRGMLFAVLGAGGEIISGITGLFSGAINWLVQAGKNVMQGLVNGVIAMKDTVVGWGETAGGWLREGIDKVWIFGSPARAAIEMGLDIMRGLIIGLGDAEQDAIKKAADIATAILKALQSGLDFARDAQAFVEGGGRLPALEFISQLRSIAERAVGEIGEVAALFATEFLEHAEIAGSAIEAAFGALNEALSFASSEFSESLPSRERLAEWVTALKFLAEHAVASIGDTAALFDGPFLDQAGRASDAIEAAFGALESVLSFVAEALPDDPFDRAKLSAWISSVKALAQHAISELGEAAALYGGDVLERAEAFADAAEAAFGPLDAAREFLVSLVEGGVLPLRADVDGLVARLVALGRYVADALVEASAEFDTEVAERASAFSDVIESAFGGLIAAFDFVMNARPLSARRFGERLTTTIDLLVETARAATLRMGEAVRSVGPRLLEDAQAFAETMGVVFETLGGVLDIAANIGSGRRRTISEETITNLVAFARKVVEAFILEFNNLEPKMFTAGVALVQGLIAGIESMYDEAVEAVASLGQALESALNVSLQIGSPSKVGWDAGVNFAASVIGGARSMLPDVSKMMSDLVNPNARPGLALAGAGVNGGGDTILHIHGNVPISVANPATPEEIARILLRRR